MALLRVNEFETKKEARKYIFCLGGRSENTFLFSQKYYEDLNRLNIHDVKVIGLYPKQLKRMSYSGWYPQPNGPDDQDDAIRGIPYSVNIVNNFISDVLKEKDLPFWLAGFSSGGVIALETALGLHSKSYKQLQGIAIHSGAILNLHSVHLYWRNKDIPILLSHSRDDDCFSWNQRYLPMKNVLSNKYNVVALENNGYMHNVIDEDLELFCKLIAE